MAKESKRKLLHYRRASLLKPTERTLQQMLEEALSKLDRVGNRFQELEGDDSDGNCRKFINLHRNALGMQFGNLVLYAGGNNRHILAIDESANELDIEQIAPPTSDDGRRWEFLDSILYYGIKDNHVVLLQSKALRSREFELHLNWLFEKAGVLSKDDAVFLNNYVPKVTKEKLENATVKSIKLGLPLYDNTELVSENEQTKISGFRPSGEGIEILNILAPNRIKNLSSSDIAESSNLEVFVEVTYKHQTDEGSQALLNKLSTALRDVGDDDIKIELKGAGTIVGSELQIKSFKNIATHNGLVEPQDVFDKMSEWLIANLEMGFIDPD